MTPGDDRPLVEVRSASFGYDGAAVLSDVSLVVRPGLTGWSQVCYSYGATVEDAMEKLQYDLFYIKNMSLSLDLFVIAKTIKTVLMRQGAQ